MPRSGPLFDDDRISPGECGDGSDRDPNGGEHHADDAECEGNLQECFSRVALDRDLACISFTNDLLHFVEQVVAGNLVLFCPGA